MARETRKKAHPKNAKHVHENWAPYCPNIPKTDEKILSF